MIPHFKGCRNDSPAFIEYQNKFYNDLFSSIICNKNIISKTCNDINI